MNNPYFRTLYTVFCLVSAICFSFWLTLALALIGYVIFDWYLEGLVLVMLTDVMFGVPLEHFHHVLFVGTIIAGIMFVGVQLGKRVTRYGLS